ncbi:C40 family peptidase [Paenibacillus hodogayensis]|uniref:C40 family peptidase n=1 Tax=Paenibacillus hodogayensis TaxID=279208 RepID=A0ABV5W6S8_9BACL
MKRLWKHIALSCVVGITVTGMSGGIASASPTTGADSGVKIQINDKLVEFPEAGPFIDGDGQTLVPMRPVFEALGYTLDWRTDNGQLKVAVQDDKKRTMEVKAGAAELMLDGKPVKLEAEAVQNRQGTAYVPLRILSETLGYIVQWDKDNRIAIIGQDGRYHAPAWYKTAAADNLMPKAEPPTVKNEPIVAMAKSMTGIRYMWGGTTPEGFDCSGFVRYVFAQNGVDLPRTSRSMYDSSGQPVVGLEPGDLVFFNTGAVATHVGIYLGEGQFVSATTSRGTKIDSLYSSYWGSRYIGARRVL